MSAALQDHDEISGGWRHRNLLRGGPLWKMWALAWRVRNRRSMNAARRTNCFPWGHILNNNPRRSAKGSPGRWGAQGEVEACLRGPEGRALSFCATPGRFRDWAAASADSSMPSRLKVSRGDVCQRPIQSSRSFKQEHSGILAAGKERLSFHGDFFQVSALYEARHTTSTAEASVRRVPARAV